MNENNPTPPSVPLTPPQPKNQEEHTLTHPHKIGTLLESLLKHPRSLVRYFLEGENLFQVHLSMFLVCAFSLLLSGVVLGSFSMHEQLWATPLKVFLGTFFSVLICFPSLYIFSCLTGTGAGLREMFSGLLGALTLLGILLISFIPVLWVFSQSTHSLGFIGGLFLAMWVIACWFGLTFLHKLLKAAGAKKLGTLKVWAGIFLLVTFQMSTSLRPLIGRSDDLLTNKKKFFIQHWAETISEISEEAEWE